MPSRMRILMLRLPRSLANLDWDPRIHSGEDNLRWSWLRSVEWGRWPLFLSQPIAPILLIWWPWHVVVVAAFVANFVWAGFVRNLFVSRWLATLGMYVVAARWITWPSSVIYLFVS